MGFTREEHCSGLPFPSPGITLESPVLQADSLPASVCYVTSVVSDSLRHCGLYPARLGTHNYPWHLEHALTANSVLR